MRQDLGLITKGYPVRQWNLQEVLMEFAPAGKGKLCDLGCGSGAHHERLKRAVPEFEYIGVDIDGSPEVGSRERDDLDFVTYDGINIPFPDEHFDIVYCHQVFEHVRYQEPLLREVRRVLRDDTGLFIGSLSGLEPYHSRSIFNLTPFGWLTVLNDNGFEALTLRPGVDGITLIKRALRLSLGQIHKTSACSELNREILGMNIPDIEKNRLMLRFAGHIIFVAKTTQIGR